LAGNGAGFDGFEEVTAVSRRFGATKAAKMRVGLGLLGVCFMAETAVGISLPDFYQRVGDGSTIAINYVPGDVNTLAAGEVIDQNIIATDKEAVMEKGADGLAGRLAKHG
jgi:hypothetical protein